MSKSKPKGNFAFIPNSTILAKKFKSIPLTARMLFVYMVVQRGIQDIEFSYSYKDIMRDSGMSYATTSKALKSLIKNKIIECKHGGLECNKNVYRINPLWLTLDVDVDINIPPVLLKPNLDKDIPVDWAVIRKKRLAYDGYRCVKCKGTYRLQVHHLTYARDGYEWLEDLQTLCSKCHNRTRVV